MRSFQHEPLLGVANDTKFHQAMRKREHKAASGDQLHEPSGWIGYAELKVRMFRRTEGALCNVFWLHSLRIFVLK